MTSKQVKTTRLDYLVLVPLVILVSGASVFFVSDYALLVTAFAFGLLMYVKRRKIDLFIVVILGLWLLVNAVAYLQNPGTIPVSTLGGYVVRLVIPYMALKIVGPEFWLKFERLLFVMVVISLPLFCLDVVFPGLFDSLLPVFKHFTADVFYLKETQATYWYSGFYTHSGRNDFRNSGFMWEPGAFAMILVVLIICNWSTRGVALSARTGVYVMALLTTFSTAGYLALFLLLAAYLMVGQVRVSKVWVLVGLLAVVAFAVQSEFLLPKLEEYWLEYQQNVSYDQYYSESYTDRYEVNRLAYFWICLTSSLQMPTGYGVIPDSSGLIGSGRVVGVNGLGSVLVMWGWMGLAFVFISVYKFCALIAFRRGEPATLLFSLAILIVFFSNPIERHPILFLIVFTPYIAAGVRHYKGGNAVDGTTKPRPI